MKYTVLLLILASTLHAKRINPESWYQKALAKSWGAKTEVSVPNGRVDIVGKTYATEVEFADKWKESIGQALWYSIQTNKKAGIVLICEKQSDLKHLIRLCSVIAHSKLYVKVWSLTLNNGKLILAE